MARYLKNRLRYHLDHGSGATYFRNFYGHLRLWMLKLKEKYIFARGNERVGGGRKESGGGRKKRGGGGRWRGRGSLWRWML